MFVLNYGIFVKTSDSAVFGYSEFGNYITLSHCHLKKIAYKRELERWLQCVIFIPRCN